MKLRPLNKGLCYSSGMFTHQLINFLRFLGALLHLNKLLSQQK